MSRMREFSDDGETLHGAYGARLLGRYPDGAPDQVAAAITQLRQDGESRRVVLRIFDPSLDLADTRDVPCTCQIQLLLRDGSLHGLSYMRSQDVFLGLPYDLAWIGMLVEFIAIQVPAAPGALYHTMGSLHLYDTHRGAVVTLAERMRSDPQTVEAPAPMSASTLEEFPQLQQFEEALRAGRGDPDAIRRDAVHFSPYSRQIIGILNAHALWRRGETKKAAEVARDEGGPLGELAAEFIRRGPLRFAGRDD
jgi:thymidylate synthase